MEAALNKQTLTGLFESLGIGSGDYVVVHSALRSLGSVEGGADAVIDALLACIGPRGLLVMPTFTYYDDPYDPAATPSRTGALTEALRKRPDAVRSLHPTHSVVAIGQAAAAICDGHHRVPGLGPDSPLDRAAKEGGTVLLLGVKHDSNSTVHVGEAYARAPYLDVPFNPEWPTRIHVEPLGGKVQVLGPPGCSRAFGAVEAGLRRRGAIRDGRIGRAVVQRMPGQAVIDSAVELLRENPGVLLCSDPACYHCSTARNVMDSTR